MRSLVSQEDWSLHFAANQFHSLWNVFGAASGAFYGATAEIIPLVKVINGLAFGLSIWIVAVEVTLPALKLAAPLEVSFPNARLQSHFSSDLRICD